ncbi:phosphodiester glycosidase family protein [Microbacterium album]|nr:phosphodiester glycosidase family protein [Microbacterium album]
MNIDSGGAAVVNDVQRTEIAPGLIHVSYDRLDADGWQQVNVLKAELSDETVKMKYLSPETVSGEGATVTEMVERARAVAGVNLDRFDINNSWAAAGWGISNGEIIKSGNPDAAASVGMTNDGLGALVDLVLQGSVVFADDTSVAITGINVTSLANNGVALYNSQWGTFSRARALSSASAGIEVWIDADGVVQAVNTTVGEGEIPEGTQILVAANGSAAANRLQQLQPGDTATVSYSVRDDALGIQEAGGAWHRLLRDGQVVNNGNGSHFTTRHPRTMIGFSEDRRTAFFVTVDGRIHTASGMLFTQMSALMRDLGAHDAISADGGGSTQMNARLPGALGTSILNTPADGVERRDGNGMGLTLARPGSGELRDIVIAPASADKDARRVFPGLHRTLVGTGVDETLTRVEGHTFAWSNTEGRVTTAPVDETRVHVVGQQRGTTTVAAATGDVRAETELVVLGDLQRLTASSSVLSLSGPEDSATISLTGHDANGFQAPVEPVDVTITGNDAGVLAVTDAGDGTFELRPAVASGGVTLTFSVGDASVQVAVTVGIEERVIYNMDNMVADGWRTTGSRATSSVVPGEGYDGGTAVHMTYDFSQSTANRTANSRPGVGHPGYPVPGQPRTIKVWVKGTTTQGSNPETYIGYSDANGTWQYSYSAAPQGTDWQQISYAIPAGTAYPIRLQMISAYETRAANQARGEMWFDDPVAEVAPEVELPIAPIVTDDTIVGAGATDDSTLRIAVVSDAQFVARNPNSGEAQGAREAFREVMAAQPDALFINGDLVDEAAVEDFALAQRIIDEELGDADFPWVYVPGNHEIMGGPISNFKDAFGDTFTSTDIKGTRFITLNTATGDLSTDFAQLPFLRDQLDDAASNDAITGVVILQHMPIDDPLVSKFSQLSDRRDAALQQDWIEKFRETSGKSIALVGSHVGIFHAATEDNIPYVLSGNSGKSPTRSDFGSFTGWMMLGIEPEAGDWRKGGKDIADDNPEWFTTETMTRVDEVSITTPEPYLELGSTVDLAPSIRQDGTRRVAVAWPMSYTWLGGTGVHVGDVADAPEDAVAAIDPVTHRLTALRDGAGEAMLTVNGVTETVSFTLGEEPRVLDVSVSASTRKLAGMQYVNVSTVNNDEVPVNITIETEFGSKTFTAVQPGKAANVSINSRSASIGAGEVTVTAVGHVDDEEITTIRTAQYAATPAS